MTATTSIPQLQPLPRYSQAEYVERLLSGGTLLPNNAENLKEVVGVLKAYGWCLCSSTSMATSRQTR